MKTNPPPKKKLILHFPSLGPGITFGKKAALSLAGLQCFPSMNGGLLEQVVVSDAAELLCPLSSVILQKMLWAASKR